MRPRLTIVSIVLRTHTLKIDPVTMYHPFYKDKDITHCGDMLRFQYRVSRNLAGFYDNALTIRMSSKTIAY